MTSTSKVLVIEDERDIAKLLALHLGDLGCEVTLAVDGHEGLRHALAGKWALIVLDLQLPGVDGLEICRRVRHGQSYSPILMLTSRSGDLDRVLGLETGADDYLTKPFNILEFIARVKAIFRRANAMRAMVSDDSPAIIKVGELCIDVPRRRVQRGGSEIELTAREFDLLVYFAARPGQVFTRAQLLDQVWGYGHEGYEHTVNSHINRLRGKIEPDPSDPQYVVTVWGVGYKFGYDQTEAV